MNICANCQHHQKPTPADLEWKCTSPNLSLPIATDPVTGERLPYDSNGEFLADPKPLCRVMNRRGACAEFEVIY